MSVIGKYGDIPGAPAKTALYAMIALGSILCVLACVGMQGASMRKTRGTEKRGLCLLIIYAVALALIIIAEITVGVVVFVWIGGSLGPLGEKINRNEKAKKLSSEGGKQADNFINCMYNECCATKPINLTLFQPEPCKMNSKDVPDSNGELKPWACQSPPCDARGSVKKACGALDSSVLSVEQCHSGIDSFQEAVANLIQENMRPIAYAACIVGGLQLILFICTVLQICWCCGKSDEPDADWYDEDDDYYYNKRQTAVVPY